MSAAIKCETCGKPISFNEGQVTEHSMTERGVWVERAWHVSCYGQFSRGYPIPIKGLRWTLEARLLAAVIARHELQTTVTKEEMEKVKGMIVNRSSDGFSVEITKP
jgi:hypothetical protein